MIVVREERPDDIAAIRKSNEEAFGQPAEADIVDKLRENCSDLLSLVAVQEGINMQKSCSLPFVIVLGHPEFYPRFGFERASAYNVRSQWDGVPDDVFMILLLNPAAMAGISGTARYRDEFNEAM